MRTPFQSALQLPIKRPAIKRTNAIRAKIGTINLDLPVFLTLPPPFGSIGFYLLVYWSFQNR